MSVQENNLTKLCSFYVSDWHLTTMLLPYINQKINEQAKIATILEKDMEQNVITLVKKLNLKNEEKILNLNWKKKIEIKDIFLNLESNEEMVIIINGQKNYIERQNIKLLRYMQKNKINGNIKIINCYEITEFNGSIQNILDHHDKILNTSGEKEIIEVFENYKRKELEENQDKAVVGLN